MTGKTGAPLPLPESVDFVPSVSINSDLSRRKLLAAGVGIAGVAAGVIGAPAAGLSPDSAMAAGGEEWILNVKDFGAVGDGVTDDAPAIQAAIYEATGWDSNTGATDPEKIAYIPEGLYMLDHQLWIPDGLTLMGAGRDLTTLRLMPSCNGPILSAPYFPNGSPFFSFPYVAGDDFTLADITLDGDAENTEQTGGSIALLHARMAARWHVARCKFMRSRSYGVGFQSAPFAENGPVEDAYFVDCEFDSNNWGGSGTGAIDTKWTRRLTMKNCVVFNDNVGFDIRSHSGTLINCHARDCAFGFVLRQTAGEDTYHTVLGGSAEGCGGVWQFSRLSTRRTTPGLYMRR